MNSKTITVPVYLCSEVKDGKVVNLSLSYSPEDIAYNRILKEREGYTFTSDYLCDIDIRRRKRRPRNTASKKPKERVKKRWAKRIRCVETGEEFGCLSDLIKSIGVKRYLLQARIKDNISVGGKHYEYID